MRASPRLFVLVAAAAAAALAGSAVVAQQESDVNRTPQGRPAAKARQAAEAARGAQQPAAAPAEAAPAPALSQEGQMIEQVIRQEEAAAAGKGLTYDAGDRRDPFISPAEAVKVEEMGECQGEGSECWLISEIALVGVLQRRAGGVALVIGPEGYGASLKAGDKLYDGEVLSVDGATGTVVFRQKVNDPTRIKPYRDIEKKLNVAREGGL
jgi:Tfp pilus assembly protein PilP